MATFLTDNFNDTAGTILNAHTSDSGATWTRYTGYSGNNTIITAAGNLRHNGTVNDAYYSSVVADAANCVIEFGFTRYGTCRNTIEIGVRALNSPVTYIGARYAHDAQGFDLIKRVNNSQSSLTSFSSSPMEEGVTYACRLIVKDNKIKLFFDGNEILSSDVIAVSGAGRVGLRFFTGSGWVNSDTNSYQINYLDAYDTSTDTSFDTQVTLNKLDLVNQLNMVEGIPKTVSIELPTLILNLSKPEPKSYPPLPIFTTNERLEEIRDLVLVNNTNHNRVYAQLSADTQLTYETSAYANGISVTYARTGCAIENAMMYSITRIGSYCTSAYNNLRLIYDDPLGTNLTTGTGLGRSTCSIAFAAVWAWCWTGMDQTQRDWVEARIIEGLNAWPSFYHDNVADPDKTSNWVGRVRGGELSLILAYEDYENRASRITTCINDLSKYLDNFGENGVHQEGTLDYGGFALSALIPAALTYKNRFNDSLLIDKATSKNIFKQYIYRHSFSTYFISDPTYPDYGVFTIGNGVSGHLYNTSNVISECLFNITSADSIGDWKYCYDKIVGISADEIPENFRYDHAQGTGTSGRVFNLLYYPQDIPITDPDESFGIGISDTGWGAYTFRNRWQDKNDTLLQINSDTQYKDHAWNQCEAFNLEFIANNECWFANPIKYGDDKAHTSLLVDGVGEINGGDVGVAEYFETDEINNKGYCIVGGGTKYSSLGLTGAKRHLFVDYVDNDTFSIFSTLDKLSADSIKEYTWQGKIGGATSATNFHITSETGIDNGIPYVLMNGRDNSYLKGWFISNNETLDLDNIQILNDVQVPTDFVGDAFRVITSADNCNIWGVFASGVGTAPAASVVTGSGINSKLNIGTRNVYIDSGDGLVKSEVASGATDITVNVTRLEQTNTISYPSISGNANLDLSRISQTNNINTPTISTQSNVTISVTRISQTNTINNPSISGVSNVSVARISQNNAINSPTISTQSNVTISVGRLEQTNTINSASAITAGNVTVSVTKISQTNTINNPSISGAALIGLNRISQSNSINSPSISGVSNISVTRISENNTINNPIISGNAIIGVAKISQNNSINIPTISTQSNVTISVSRISQNLGLNNPTVLAGGNVTVNVNRISQSNTINNPSISGIANIGVTRISESNSLINPSVKIDAIINFTKISQTNSINIPTVSTVGSVTIQVNRLEQTLELNNPSILAQSNVTISPTRIGQNLGLYNPSISGSSNVSVTRISENNTINNPIISTQSNVTIFVSRIEQSNIINNVNTQGSSNVTINISRINQTLSLINPSVKIDAIILAEKISQILSFVQPEIYSDCVIEVPKIEQNITINNVSYTSNSIIVEVTRIEQNNEINLVGFKTRYEIIIPITGNTILENGINSIIGGIEIVGVPINSSVL